MLLCFGLGWPISIAKSVRTKTVSGKSPLFMCVIMLGYASGLTHKIIYSKDLVLYLYAINLILVTVDLMIYFRYRNYSLKAERVAPSKPKRVKSFL